MEELAKDLLRGCGKLFVNEDKEVLSAKSVDIGEEVGGVLGEVSVRALLVLRKAWDASSFAVFSGYSFFKRGLALYLAQEPELVERLGKSGGVAQADDNFRSSVLSADGKRSFLGVEGEDRSFADERSPFFLGEKAAVGFLCSAAPLKKREIRGEKVEVFFF